VLPGRATFRVLSAAVPRDEIRHAVEIPGSGPPSHRLAKRAADVVCCK
jgi:hypothetical protein